MNDTQDIKELKRLKHNEQMREYMRKKNYKPKKTLSDEEKRERKKEVMKKCIEKKKKNGTYMQKCEICGTSFPAPAKTLHLNTLKHKYAILKIENENLKIEKFKL